MKNDEVSAVETRNPPVSRRYWWLLAQGICAIAFGVVAIFWPGLTFIIFLYIFGVYLIIAGAIMIISAFHERRAPERWENNQVPAQPGSWLIRFMEGLLTIVCGLFCLIEPHLSAQITLYVAALWSLMVGISLLVRSPTRGFPLALAGIVAIAISLLLFLSPLSRIQSILWLIGIGALLLGGILLVLGWKMRAARQTLPEPELPPI